MMKGPKYLKDNLLEKRGAKDVWTYDYDLRYIESPTRKDLADLYLSA